MQNNHSRRRNYSGHKIRVPYEQRKRELSAHYAANPPAPKDFHWAVIQIKFRGGMSIEDTAQILNTDFEMIDSAIDTIKQQAQ